MTRRTSLATILLLALLPGISARAEDNVASCPVEPLPAIRVAAVGDIMMGTTFPEPILPPPLVVTPRLRRLGGGLRSWLAVR